MKELLRQPDTNTLKIVTNNKTCNKSGIIRYDILRNIKKHIISVNDRRKNWKKPKKRINSRVLTGKRKTDSRIFRFSLY
jgi:hypothetical protein